MFDVECWLLDVFPTHSHHALPAAVVALAVEINQNVARLGGLCGHGFTHRARGRFRQRFAGTIQFGNFFAHQFRELVVGLLFRGAVADAAPRKQVGTVAHIELIGLAPLNKFQITVGRIHRLVSRIALRTCFSW
jgi:hypothetical protein